MKITVLVLRILVGVLLLVSGFMNLFMESQMPTEGAMGVYIDGLMASGFIMPTMGIIFLLVGLSFLTGRFLIFSAIVLFPIAYSMTMTHLVFDIKSGIAAFLVMVTTILVLVQHKHVIAPLFKAKSELI